MNSGSDCAFSRMSCALDAGHWMSILVKFDSGLNSCRCWSGVVLKVFEIQRPGKCEVP